jgi:hypothetical protein
VAAAGKERPANAASDGFPIFSNNMYDILFYVWYLEFGATAYKIDNDEVSAFS